MNSRRPITLVRFGLILMLIGPAQKTTARIPIEEVQREYQGRVYFLSGGYDVWPACPCGTPAPNFPPDGFYGDLDHDRVLATQLVQDLASKFYGDLQYDNFINTPDGMSGIQGQGPLTLATNYDASNFPANVAGADMTNPLTITTNNYADCLASLRSYIMMLQYLYCPCSLVNSDPNGYDAGDSNTQTTTNSCKAAQDLASAAWLASGWQKMTVAYGYVHAWSAETWDPGGFWDYGAQVSDQRCKLWANPNQGTWHCDSGTMTGFLQLWADNGGVGNENPPLNNIHADTNYWEVDSQSVSAPSQYYSPPIADFAPPRFNTATCPNNMGSPTFYGWTVVDQLVVLKPKFRTDPDNVNCGDGGCSSSCGGGANTPGSVDAKTDSLNIDVRISLGNNNQGTSLYGLAAGYFYFHADQPSAALYDRASLLYITPTGNGTGDDGVLTTGNVNAFITNITGGYTICFSNSTPAFLSSVTVSNYNNNINQMFITELFAGGSPRVMQFNYTAATATWDLLRGNGLTDESRSTVWTTPSNRTDTIVVKDNNGVIARQTTEQYQVSPWGLTLLQRTLGTGGTARTTTWTYYQASDGTNNYGQVKQMVDWTGRWERYQYDFAQRLTNKVVQFMDSAITTADSANRVTQIGFDDTHSIVTNIEFLQGTEVARSYEARWVDSGNLEKTETIQCTKRGAAINDAANLTNVVWRTVDANYTTKAWDPVAELHPDGTMTVYTYTYGNHEQIVVQTGATAASWSTMLSSTWNDWPAIIDGTTTTTIVGTWGEVLSRQVVDIASGITTGQENYTYLDILRRSYSVTYPDTTSETYNYSCCGLTSMVDRDSVTTSYTYDAAQRQIASTRLNISTTNILDAASQVLQTCRIGTDGSSNFLSGAAYDYNGMVVRETNGLYGVTFHAQSFNGSSEPVITDTYPDGGTRISTSFQDGTTSTVTGTQPAQLKYIYGVDSDGRYSSQIKLTSTGGTNEWVKTSSDMLGRTCKTTYASSSTLPYAVSDYNQKGQLTNQIDPDGVSTIFAYFPRGELAYTVVDSNRNYTIDFSGSDRITFVTNGVVVDNGSNVRRTRTYVWSTSAATSNLISTVEISTDGLKSWNTVWNGGVAATTQTTTAPGNTRTVTAVNPDNSSKVTVYQNGRLTSVTLKDSGGSQIGQTTYAYDAHGRQNTVTDARTGTTTYYFNQADLVNGIVTPAPGSGQSAEVTTNYFDTCLRKWKTTLPDGTSVTNKYDVTGLLTNTFGSRTYPVAYTYDTQGRMKTMTTWTSFANSLGAATTTWNYDGYRGWLTNKAYADGKGPAYGYTGAGRLASRLWARGTNTVYAYNNAGDLSSVTYSDGVTPNLSYGYDRRGRPISVTQGTITTTKTYDDAGHLLTEAYTGGPLGGVTVTNAFDSYLRKTAVGLSTQPSTLVQYGYDTASRLSAVTNGSFRAPYTYLANSPLVSQIGYVYSGVSRMTTTKQYDNLNRLTQISSVPSAGATASFNYQYNSANQRTAVTNADSSLWQYGYDALGQVITGKKYWNDGTAVAGEQFEYSFDDIGNRQSTKAGGDQWGANLRYATYAANNLNQYTTRTVPGAVDVIGTAANTATVTVNNTPTYRRGNFYQTTLSLPNTSAAVWQSVTNLAVLNNGSNPDILTNANGNIFLPQTPENFSYDLDGNLTQDGRWQYTWDAENRLVSIQGLSSLPTAAKLKLDFLYDYQSRRTQKLVSTNSGSGYVAQVTNRFVYDGWNPIANLNPQLAVIQSFTWGLDLSGSVQGAGGVGGLLNISDTANGNHMPCYDGNGNVAQLTKASDGTVSAQYEYGPFGEVIRATGPVAKANPFRFSTKYQDDETDLLYYGYRYYTANTGRWITRDPHDESGGLNLYAAVLNSPVEGVDPYGLEDLRFTSEGHTFVNGTWAWFGTFYRPAYALDHDESGTQGSPSAFIMQWAMLYYDAPWDSLICNSTVTRPPARHPNSYVHAKVTNVSKCRLRVSCYCTLSYSIRLFSPSMKRDAEIFGNVLGVRIDRVFHARRTAARWMAGGSDSKTVGLGFLLGPGEERELYYAAPNLATGGPNGGFEEQVSGACRCETN